MPKKKSGVTSSRGSTLIEVLIAVAIMSVVMTAVGSMLTGAVRTMAVVQSRVRASQDAQKAMEYFRYGQAQSWTTFAADSLAAAPNPVLFYCLAPTNVTSGSPPHFPPVVPATTSIARVAGVTDHTGCYTFDEVVTSGRCPAFGPNNMYGRMARVEMLSPTSLSVRVDVVWEEGDRSTCTQLTQIFSKEM